MDTVAASSQSIQTWRTAYKNGGLQALLHNGRKGKAGKPSIFTKEEHKKIEQKLKDPKNGLAGYIELQQWVEQEFKKSVKSPPIPNFNLPLQPQKYIRNHV